MNKVIHGDCLDVMATFPDNYIDLTVTSPPYDNLRDYNGYDFNFEGIANQLYRITKQGGVVVWVVCDATINGSETGTSFRQVLHFKDIGFNLHDTMIWTKEQLAFPDKNRYYSGFEYMFVLSKGKPKTIKLIGDKKNRSFGRVVDNSGERKRDGSLGESRSCAGQPYKEYGVRWNYWLMFNQSRGNYANHPAPFPEKLANDHIITWSNEGDLVLDPMCGSGTTCKMAMVNNRNYIGIDISEEYCEIARKRVAEHEQQQTLFAEKNL